MLDRFKKQQPDCASTIKIQVVNLEGVLKTLQSGSDQQLNQIMLIPPRESIEFVRSLQPTAAQNQNRPAATPSKKPLNHAPTFLGLTPDWSTTVVSGLELWQWRTVALCAAIAADVPPAEVDWLLKS
jgi:hypothetical protein